jgi:hypothetical protein
MRNDTTFKFALRTFLTLLTQIEIISNIYQMMITRIKPEQVCVQQLRVFDCCVFIWVRVCCFSWYPDLYP